MHKCNKKLSFTDSPKSSSSNPQPATKGSLTGVHFFQILMLSPTVEFSKHTKKNPPSLFLMYIAPRISYNSRNKSQLNIQDGIFGICQIFQKNELAKMQSLNYNENKALLCDINRQSEQLFIIQCMCHKLFSMKSY